MPRCGRREGGGAAGLLHDPHLKRGDGAKPDRTEGGERRGRCQLVVCRYGEDGEDGVARRVRRTAWVSARGRRPCRRGGRRRRARHRKDEQPSDAGGGEAGDIGHHRRDVRERGGDPCRNPRARRKGQAWRRRNVASSPRSPPPPAGRLGTSAASRRQGGDAEARRPRRSSASRGSGRAASPSRRREGWPKVSPVNIIVIALVPLA